MPIFRLRESMHENAATGAVVARTLAIVAASSFDIAERREGKKDVRFVMIDEDNRVRVV
jgi:hypothetical protein